MKFRKKPNLPEESIEDCNLLFVYGTLMRGFENAKFLQAPEKARFLGRGKARGLLYDVGEFPAFIPVEAGGTENEAWVYGEIYRAEDPESLLGTLDVIEGVNHFYPERSLFVRKKLPAMIDKEEQTVWIYVYNQPVQGLPVIPHGDYRRFAKERGFGPVNHE